MSQKHGATFVLGYSLIYFDRTRPSSTAASLGPPVPSINGDIVL